MQVLTTAPQGSNEWLAARKAGIGGSDAAAALGISKWKTPLEVYREKVGESDGQPDNWFMARGRAMEPVIRQQYADETGEAVRICDGIFQHAQHSFMLFSADGITESGKLFEAKTANSKIGWGDEGSDQVPHEYLVQVQHGLAVTGLSEADIAVSFFGNSPVIFHIPARPDIQEMIIEGEREFWRKVQERVEPEATTSEELLDKFRIAHVDTGIEADEVTAELVARLRTTKEAIADLEVNEEELKAAIMQYMGANDTLLYKGERLVTWKNRAGSKRMDSKALEAAYPDIAKQFTVAGSPTRTFLLK